MQPMSDRTLEPDVKRSGSPAALLSVTGIQKWFGALHALDGVSFDIAPGETVGLVGDNGAGKSTLLKVLSGVHQPTEGTITLEGKEVSFHDPAAARRSGIETVYQDLALVSRFTIAENMFLGRELATGTLMRKRAMRKASDEALSALNIKVPHSDRTVARMSGGQRQAVAIARGAYWCRNVILLDEPTAALGVREAADVLRLVEELRGRGLATVLVTHNLDHLWSVCTRVMVMRRGRLVADRPLDRTSPSEVISEITGAAEVAERMMPGRSLQAAGPQGSAPLNAVKTNSPDTVRKEAST